MKSTLPNLGWIVRAHGHLRISLKERRDSAACCPRIGSTLWSSTHPLHGCSCDMAHLGTGSARLGGSPCQALRGSNGRSLGSPMLLTSRGSKASRLRKNTIATRLTGGMQIQPRPRNISHKCRANCVLASIPAGSARRQPCQ